MKRKIVNYDVIGFKSDDDGNTKQVVRKLKFEIDVDESPLLSEEDYYCVVQPKGSYVFVGENTDGEVLVEKSGEVVFTKDIIDEIVADQRKVGENAEVKVYTLKNILSTNFYYNKDDKRIFNNYYNIQIINVESIPSNILEIISKLELLSNVYFGIVWDDINDVDSINKIDEMIEENFIFTEEIEP